MNHSNQELISRRGELLAELFLQDLNPAFVARNSEADVGIDFFVGFRNSGGGLNFVAVEVKSTEKPALARVQLHRRTYALLANSNIPGLLLVVDVKANQYFFRVLKGPKEPSTVQMVSVELEAATPTSIASLRVRLSGSAP